MHHFSRRDVLKAAPLAAAPFLFHRAAAQAPPAGTFPGMIVRMEQPRNLEFPFGHLNDWKTPTDQFFVRSHFAVPEVDPKAFRLVVEGHVENRLDLSLADVRAMPAATTPLTLECAGNGRVHLIPQARGLQWGEGAVGTADWTGVPLSAILEKAKPKPGAAEVVLVGADKGAVTSDPPSPGQISFERSIPLEKAKKPEVLLAYGMNGGDLPASHGAPLRAVVGGWYGVASVKWLTRIVVTTRPHRGFWQTLDYSYFERRDGLPVLVPVTRVQPKASIARPALHEAVPAGKPYRVRGAAWAGESRVAKVEVSTDGGKSWAAAKLTGEDRPFCWRLWEFDWTPAAAGPAKLVARCTDAAGTAQPDQRDPDRRSYMINHLVPVEVAVR